MANKFDKPYHTIIKFDERKISDLFMRINNMNTHEIKQFSLIEQIPLSITDNEGNNAIHRVLLNTEDRTKTEQQRLAMIQFLCNENVNPDQPNAMNVTPLHIACMKQYATIVDYLLNMNVNPNYQDNMGSTPFHKFLAGKIRLEETEERKEQGLIVPKQKKIDRDYVDRWTLQRNKIWNVIKTSPYLDAIASTIKDTIKYNNMIGVETIKAFQEELYKLNTKDNGISSIDIMKELKTLRDISIKKFKSDINKRWGNFPSIDNISIHQTEANSWPQNNDAPNNLSVVKKANSDVYLQEKMDKNIKELDKTLAKVSIPEKINVDSIYNELKNYMETNNIGINYNAISPDERMITFYEEYKDPNAIDFASDIIDWERHTFVGGSRVVRIVNQLAENDINQLLMTAAPANATQLQKIVYTMAYGLVDNNIGQILGYCDANANNFNYMEPPGGVALGTALDDLIVRYIVAIIEDTVDNERIVLLNPPGIQISLENGLIEMINQNININYIYLLKLIEQRSTSNKISWLYTFATTYKSKRDFIQGVAPNPLPNTDLVVEMNQIFIYLITAFANNKTDMLLSIHQVLKPRLIQDIIFQNGFGIRTANQVATSANIVAFNLGEVYCTWIYFLFTSNKNYAEIKNNIIIQGVRPRNLIDYITNLRNGADPENADLLNIVKYTNNFFNNQINGVNNVRMDWLNISRETFNKLSEGEILCCMIIRYYTDMPQKPLLQNVVDTISLIRYRATNTNDANFDTKLNILNRIKTLYEAPFNGSLINGFLGGAPIVGNGANRYNIGPPPNVPNDLHRIVDDVLPNVLYEPNALNHINPLRRFFNLFNIKNAKSIELFLLTEYCLPSKINFYLSKGFDWVDNIPLLVPNQYEHSHYLLKKIEASHLGLCFMGLLPTINIPQHENPPPADLTTGTVFSNGTIIPNGTILQEGTQFPQGVDIPNDTVLPLGTVFPPGTILPTGFIITATTVFPRKLLLPFNHNVLIDIPGQITFPAGTKIPNTANFPEGTFIDGRTVITHNNNFPAGTIIPVGTTIPQGVIWMPNAVYPSNRPAWNNIGGAVVIINCRTGIDIPVGQPIPANTLTITFQAGTTIPPGVVFPAGTFISNTTIIDAQTILPLNTIIPRGTSITVNTQWTRNVGIIGGNAGTLPNPINSICAILSPNVLPINIPAGGAAQQFGNDIILPVGTVIPAGTIIPLGTNITGATILSPLNAGVLQPISFPNGNVILLGTTMPNGTIISAGTDLPDGTIFINGTRFPIETTIDQNCVFPLGTVLPQGTILVKGTSIPSIKKTIVVKRSPYDYMHLNLPKDSVLPVGTVLRTGFTFTEDSYLPQGTVFIKGSVLIKGTVIEPPSIETAQDDASYYSMFHYYHGRGTLTKNKPYFYTNQNETLFRPPTRFSYLELLNGYVIKLSQLKNKVNSLIGRTMKDFKLTSKSSAYALIVAYSYPALSALSSHDQLIKDLYDEYKEFLNSTESKEIDWKKEVLERLDKLDVYNIKDFEKNINAINSYIYLYYYLNSRNDNDSVRIPKFIYHQLGMNKQIIFNHNSNVIYPPNESNTIAIVGERDEDNDILNPPLNESQYNPNPDPQIFLPDIDRTDKTGTTSYIKTSSYSNVINGVNEGMYYITKQILDRRFVDSKRNKLPPSFESSDMLVEFYKLNTIKLITQNPNLLAEFVTIDDKLIREQNLRQNLITTQKFYMGAKMVEELVQLYLKNKVFEIGLSLYNNVIRTTKILPINLATERLFDDKYKFDVALNELPSSNILSLVTRNNLLNHILLNLFPFTKIVDNPNNNDIFYNYPDDYNGTTLLKSKYRVDIDRNILNRMIEKRANLFIHNNEMMSPLSQLIKTLHYPTIERVKRDFTIRGIGSFNYNTYGNQVNSPYAYLFEQYKNHTKKFFSKPTLVESIKSFVAPQFNEIKNIIQSNDSFNNNILVNLELSFSICNYLTQHYLTENVFRNTSKYSNNYNIWLDNIMRPIIPIRSMTDLYYNTILARLSIPSQNEGILYDLIGNEYTTKIRNMIDKVTEYNNELRSINRGRQQEVYNQLVIKIRNINNKMEILNRADRQLLTIKNRIPLVRRLGLFNNPIPRIIPRYDDLLNRISPNQYNKLRGSYIMGWNNLLERHSNNSPDLIIGRVLVDEMNLITPSNNITQLQANINRNKDYYQHMHDIAKSYFEKPRFTKQNKVLRFVYDMLVHLTQNILCNSFELIIRKILFQASQSIDYLELQNPLIPLDINFNPPVLNPKRMAETHIPINNAFTKTYQRIDYILTDEMLEYLYGEVATKLVINSASIYEDMEDKESYETQTVAEILNSFIDLMATNSPIDIEKQQIEILKKNIVPYFDSIVGKTITNWNVCSENMFLFMINQYRLIATINASL